ncbi:MAG: hypothetical protein KGJ62_13095 [Armatimonadetes bacterium]|nr:hypothetical protein [Armatimonadota bacterium]MDE2206138.1 hypothetical protein [Armatimonadota bacterium]
MTTTGLDPKKLAAAVIGCVLAIGLAVYAGMRVNQQSQPVKIPSKEAFRKYGPAGPNPNIPHGSMPGH